MTGARSENGINFSNFSLSGLSVFAVFYGLDWIATVPPTLRLTIQRFGRGKANIVFGWIFTGHQIGAAAAAYGAGLMRTSVGSYLPALFSAGAFCILAAALIIAIGSNRELDMQPV
jgi:predicted MFS family arabinose efflux permease